MCLPFDRIKTTGLRIVCDYPNGYTKVVALFNVKPGGHVPVHNGNAGRVNVHLCVSLETICGYTEVSSKWVMWRWF